ncbi:VCBS domain-containing protein [Roseateles sp. PN1]|uniref:VCBS domain-containing protein n=1 Tax=Roseateles sp. PN1 TaxID=3137372 RepID=UPI00313901DA
MNNTSTKTKRKFNAAQLLRNALGVSRLSVPAPSRQRRLHIEALEPRHLLSGEGLVVPPTPERSALESQQLQLPIEHLLSQVLASTPGFAGNAWRPGMGEMQASQTADEVVFVDPSVQGHEALLQDALGQRHPGQIARVEVVVLDPEQDGVQQISQWLSQRQGLKAIHLISHGEDGRIGLGRGELNADNLAAQAESLQQWRAALGADADILVYGCDVAASTRGQSFIEQLAALTGADVAASSNITGDQAHGGDWLLERQTGQIDAQALFSAGQTYAGRLQLTAATLTMNAGLQAQMLAVLAQVDANGTQALKHSLINSALPGLNQSVNQFIGLSDQNGGGATTTLFGLQAAAQSYFNSQGAASTLAGLGSALQTAVKAKTDAIEAGKTGQSWSVTLTPSFDASAPEVVAGFKLSIDLDWTRSNRNFTLGWTLNGPQSSAWTGDAKAGVHIALSAGLVLDGVTAATQAAALPGLAKPSAAQSFFKFERCDVSLELTPTGANSFHLLAGVQTKLRDPDNADNKGRLSLADIGGQSAAQLQLPQLSASIDGAVAGAGFFGKVVGGELTLQAFEDATLDATGNGLKSVFDAGKLLGGQLDLQDVLSQALPFVDTGMASLLRTADGRSIGDVLAFKTPQGTTVLDDYLAESGNKTLGGLLSRLRDYLTAQGRYQQLEAMVAPDFSSDFMNILGSGARSGNKVVLELDLTLSRDFMRRFTFKDKLQPLGLDFLPGGAVPLNATVHLGLRYDTSTARSLEITKLDARVRSTGALDAAMSLGMLEARARGSLNFDTGTLVMRAGHSSEYASGNWGTFSVQNGFASALNPAEILAVSSQDFDPITKGNWAVQTAAQVSASASFDIEGVIGAGANGSTSFSTLEGGTPRVDISFNGGNAALWSEVKSKSLQVSSSNFVKLQAFAALDAAALTRMMQDLGTYLRQLRDAGPFDAVLPFTDKRLGEVLDFSKLFNQVLNEKLQNNNGATVVGGRLISPVLPADTSFDLQVQRPGDVAPTVVSVGVRASETSAFTHINQLAELINRKLAAALDGNLRWQATQATAQATVNQTIAGGVALNSALRSNEEQRIDLLVAGGNFSLKLGNGGTATNMLSVLSSTVEVQQALESLPEIGKGNVLVTGGPKHYIVSFVREKAGQAIELLKASLSDSSAANAGGLVDVVSSNLGTGSDGHVWGRLNIIQARPDVNLELRVSATAGASLTEITVGSASANAVQRLTLVHAGDGSSFILGGKKADGSPFTTGAISRPGNTGTWSQPIADALNAIFGAGAVSVSPVSSEALSVNQGVQVFDIVFNGAAVANKPQPVLAVDGRGLLAKLEAQGALTVLSPAKMAVGNTPASNEVQRLMLDQVTAGSLGFGFAVGGKVYESNSVSWSVLQGAGNEAALKTALVDMFRQWDAKFSADSLQVSKVAGRDSTWDIQFAGPWAGGAGPELKLNLSGLIGPASSGFKALDNLGFSLAGQDSQVNRAISFRSFNDLMQRFQQAVNDSLAGTGTSFSVNPRFDPATTSLLFDLDLRPAASSTEGVRLQLQSALGNLSGISSQAGLELSSKSFFKTTVGIDLRAVNGFSLRASGAYQTTIKSTADAPAQLPFDIFGISDANFGLSFDGERYDFSLAWGDTTGNTTAEDLRAQLQGLLNSRNTAAGGVLNGLGFANVGEAVKVRLDGKKLILVSLAGSEAVQLSIPSEQDAMSRVLGFQPTTMYTQLKAVKLPENGRLSGKANFELLLDQSGPVSVQVALDNSNASLKDLLADINAALAQTNISGHAYLGAGGKGFSNLGQVLRASLVNNQIELVSITRSIASLQIRANGADPATTDLGFTPGQFARTGGAEVFLQNTTLGGQYSAIVHGQVGSDAAVLDQAGRARLGLLDLSFGSLKADYQGSLSFQLRNGANGQAGDRISLNSLFDAVAAQDIQLGLGSSLSTNDTSVGVAATLTPATADGRLLRDVGLQVTIGALRLDVVIRQDATAANTSLADLAADVDAAIHAAVLAKLGNDPYAGHAFVGVDSVSKDKLKFIAATSTLNLAQNAAQMLDASTGRLLVDLPLNLTQGGTTLAVLVSAASTAGNSSMAQLLDSIRAAVAEAARLKIANTSDAQMRRDLNIILARTVQPLAVADGLLLTGSSGLLSIGRNEAGQAATAPSLERNPDKFYDSNTGRLLQDLVLESVYDGATVSFTLTVAESQSHQSMSDLLSALNAKLRLALTAAKTAAAGDAALTAKLDGMQAALDGLPMQVSGNELQLQSDRGLSLASGQLTLTNLDIVGRALLDDFMSSLVFADAAGTPGSSPSASLTLGNLGLITPTGVSSPVTAGTTLGVTVNNLRDALSGAAKRADTVLVPSDGLGQLTAMSQMNWGQLVGDLSLLPQFIADLAGMGKFGELGRLVPLLGSNLGELFGLKDLFAKVVTQLQKQSSGSLMDMQALLASAFGTNAGDITLGMDTAAGAEALTIGLPLTLNINKKLPLKLLLKDPDLIKLLSPAQQAALAKLAGNLTQLSDMDGSALMTISGSFRLNLALGLDLSSGANRGKLFLYDHRADAGYTPTLDDDSGTFASFSLTAVGEKMNFDSSQGLYSLAVRDGSASVLENANWQLNSGDKASNADRLYLNPNAPLSASDLAAVKKDAFDVWVDSASKAEAKLPLQLVLSDDLGQLAIQNIEGFVNPLPLGTMELNFANLAKGFAIIGGDTSQSLFNAQVLESAKPPRPPSTGNGAGNTTPEGAPVDTADNKLPGSNLNPNQNNTAGQGSSTSGALPGGQAPGSTSPWGSGGPNPSTAGFDLSLLLPDLKNWQSVITSVIEKAGGGASTDDKPINYSLIFLLRDPTIIVNTVDTLLGTVQKGLDAFSSVLNLPIIGDKLRDATQFIADLRVNVIDALKDALSSAVDEYGGLDNALRMFLFKQLTLDTNADGIINAIDIAANPFRNFLQDYNGDGKVTADDVVVEYLAGPQRPLDPRLAQYLGVEQGNTKLVIPAILPGQRTAWVTAGVNTPVWETDANGAPLLDGNGAKIPKLKADGTQLYTQSAGNVVMDASLQRIVDDVVGAMTSSGATLEALFNKLKAASDDVQKNGYPDTIEKMAKFVLKAYQDASTSGYSYDSLLRDVFGGSVAMAAAKEVAGKFKPSDAAKKDAADTLKRDFANGSYDIPATLLNEFKQAVAKRATTMATNVALGQSSAIQFRMKLGQTYTPKLDLGFDIGLPGLNLKLDGGLDLRLGWSFYLGFGVDVNDGFYVVTNMPGNAGIGELTNLKSDGTVDATRPFITNSLDSHISNLWLVGKPTQVNAVKELQFTVDAYLKGGSNGGPASLNAEVLTLNGTLTDNWDGWIRDNDGGIWGKGVNSVTGEQMNPTYGRTEELFRGQTGKDGSRTQFHGAFSVDLKDRGLFGVAALSSLTNGRLTYADLRGGKLSDLVKVDWAAQAQVNMHMKLGTSLGGKGYLPEVKGDLHVTWQDSSKSAVAKKIDAFFGEGYEKLVHYQPSVWMTDMYLDAGTFFSQFLKPIVGVVNDVTGPIMPVIDALTTPIPGLSEFMGRDYSALDLASDMAKISGGNAKVDFVIAMANMIKVLQNLPTDSAGMLLPVAKSMIILGEKDRKLNFGAKLPVPDVTVELPYKELPPVHLDAGDGVTRLDLEWGVGFDKDLKLSEAIKGDLPNFNFDFKLSADAKVPAPYETWKVIHFTIPGLKDTTGADAQFKMEIGVGWQNLKVSDVLSGKFAPQFDVKVTCSDVNFNLRTLPPLSIKVPTITARVLGQDYAWTVAGADANGNLNVDWAGPLKLLQDDKLPRYQIADFSGMSIALPEIKPFLLPVEFKPMTVHWNLMGKEHVWRAFDLSGAAASFNATYARLIDFSSGQKVSVTLPDVWLPTLDLPDFLPDWDFSLPDFSFLKNLIPSISIPDLPGQVSISPAQGLADFKAALKKPGSALKFPILDNPLGSVINMLSGKPTDLMTFTPPKLEVNVGFRQQFPIYPPLFGGLKGEINLKANLTFGFDTLGIAQFLNSKKITDIFNGFYVSDNIINGKDMPEVVLNMKLAAFAELNGGIIRGGVEGGIRMIGTVDLYDENRDNKFRASEIIAAVSDDPFDVVELHLKGTAYIAAYLDVFALVKYVRVFEYTFVEATLFEWEHDPAAKKPVLGSMDGDVLTLHMGSGLAGIDGNASIDKGAEDRKRRDTTDGNEQFTLTEQGGLKVTAVLPNGKTYEKTFSGVNRVKAYTGAGDDKIDASALSAGVSVLFVAGGGKDVLIGGAGDDVLIGSLDGQATLYGGGGNDRLIARGGVTQMEGGDGDDTYRFLDGWGQATVSDASGANVLDFTAQNRGVLFNDGLHQATEGSNKLSFSASDRIDLVKGGKGEDRLDFSVNQADLLLTLTGMNAGWVKNSASGMIQTGLPASAAQAAAGDSAGFGFLFQGFEHVVGGRGSDVFRVQDGAGVSGSLTGESSLGDLPNQRNTLDFSEYKRGVTVNLEGNSAFGTGGLSNITVRGFHNVFGGAGNDRLTGDGRNNLLVGNAGADVLEGQAGNDLLIADTFLTYKNEGSKPAGLQAVSDYLSLQVAGGQGGFGLPGQSVNRTWIWKGQTLENLSLGSNSQTLKGGSGDDILMGALGADTFNIGGTGEGDDTIMGDLGQIMVDFDSRQALFAKTFASLGGSADTIYLGGGSNLVLAGNGGDTIIGADTALSSNIILADNGEVSFKRALNAKGKWTFTQAGGFQHMLDYATSDVAETGGGNDIISLANGSALVIGGAGKDQIGFSAGSSFAQNFRFIAGDHARVDTDALGGVKAFYSLDTQAATGGDDQIMVGDPRDASDRFLGSNYIIAGVGSDTVLISAGLDAATGALTYGRAQSTDVIIGDNGRIERYDSAPAAGSVAALGNQLKSVQSTDFADASIPAKDLIVTGNGDKTIIGGAGEDTITVAAYGADAVLGSPQSQATRLIAGDNANISFDNAGGMTDMVSTDQRAETAGADRIAIGSAGDASNHLLGSNFIIAGFGSDTVLVSAGLDAATGALSYGRAQSSDVIIGDNGRIERSVSVPASGGQAAVPNILSRVQSTDFADVSIPANDLIVSGNGDKTIIGGSGQDRITVAAYGADAVVGSPQSQATRLIVGDNARISFDAAGGMTEMVSTDLRAETGGNDVIRIGKVGSSTALGLNFVIGGMGSDDIFLAGEIDANTGRVITGTGLSEDVLIGDNGLIQRAALSNKMLLVRSTETDKGGDDRIVTGHGAQVMLGGFGNDQLQAGNGTGIAIGDSGELIYDQLAKNGVLRQAHSIDAAIGGNDTLGFGEGYKLLIGGFGRDSLEVSATGQGVAADLAFVTGIAGLINTTGLSGAALKAAQTENRGRTGRFVAGDNARAIFDAKGGLVEFGSTDAISATGSDDQITLGARDTTADLGLQVVLGGMGSDQIVVRTGSRSEDVIFGDSGEYKRQALGYGVLAINSLAADKGGDDRISTGAGQKIVLGGMGGDRIDVATRDASDSAIVLGDSGELSYDPTGSSNLQTVNSKELGFGGDDLITLGAGEIVALGGYGRDSIKINADSRNMRVVVGDNADLRFYAGATPAERSLADLVSSDASISTGDGDLIQVGVAGADQADMGEAILVGGMGADQITVSGRTAKVVMAGDNIELRRHANGQLLSVGSLGLDQGAGDGLSTVAGDVVMIGGVGGDTLRAGSGNSLVLGDSGRFVFDASGSGALRQAVSLGLALGGNDDIALGNSGASQDGDKIVIGGGGSDTILIQSVRGSSDISQPRPNAAAQPERAVAGDNAALQFDSAGRLTDFISLDADPATGGNDDIQIVMSGAALNANAMTDVNIVAGGVGSDRISITGATRSRDVVSGDNLEFHRTDGSAADPAKRYQNLYAEAIYGAVGGDDEIRLGAGEKIVLGGAGSDKLETLTQGADDYNVMLGDAGSVVFESDGSGRLKQVFATQPLVGGNDRLQVGGGRSYVMGGRGNDVITVNASDAQRRILVGDNAQIDFAAGAPIFVQSTGPDDADLAMNVDTFVLPVNGSQVLLGGNGLDQRLGGVIANDIQLPGNGSIDLRDALNTVISVTVLGEYGELGLFGRPLTKPDPSGSTGNTDPIIGSPSGAGQVGEDGVLSASGKLGLPALGGGAATFPVQTLAGQYGSLSLKADGSWVYVLDNASAQVQALKTGETRVDSFVVQTVDGSSTVVSITVTGQDDATLFGGDLQGALSESQSAALSGLISFSNADAGQVLLQAQQRRTAYGQFTLTEGGAWTYVLDTASASVQALAAGQQLDDQIELRASNGTITVLRIRITGVNNTPLIGGSQAGLALEGSQLPVKGQLSIADADGGQSGFVASIQGSVFGQFSLAADGSWQYQLNADATALQALAAGEERIERFDVVTADGSKSQVVITVRGINNIAIIGGDTTARLPEDSADLVRGQLSIRDVDAGQDRFVASQLSSAYGQFSLQADGSWVYQLDAQSAALKALTEGQQVFDRFELRSVDGSVTAITVTLVGVNNRAQIGGSQGGVALQGASQALSGQLTVVDADAAQSAFRASQQQGVYGQFALSANGQWAYVLNAESSAVQALREGDLKQERFELFSADGTRAEVLVDVRGTMSRQPDVIAQELEQARKEAADAASLLASPAFGGSAASSAGLANSPSQAASQLNQALGSLLGDPLAAQPGAGAVVMLDLFSATGAGAGALPALTAFERVQQTLREAEFSSPLQERGDVALLALDAGEPSTAFNTASAPAPGFTLGAQLFLSTLGGLQPAAPVRTDALRGPSFDGAIQAGMLSLQDLAEGAGSGLLGDNAAQQSAVTAEEGNAPAAAAPAAGRAAAPIAAEAAEAAEPAETAEAVKALLAAGFGLAASVRPAHASGVAPQVRWDALPGGAIAGQRKLGANPNKLGAALQRKA